MLRHTSGVIGRLTGVLAAEFGDARTGVWFAYVQAGVVVMRLCICGKQVVS